MNKQAFRHLVYVLGGLFSVFSLSDTCGEAKIVSGSHCSNLQVQFFLGKCGGPIRQKGQVVCVRGGAEARIIAADKLFSIPLREVAPGVWVLLGNVNEAPAPKVMSIKQEKTTEKEAVNNRELLKILGDFRVRTEQNRFNDLSLDRAFNSLRLRPGFRLEASDNASFFFQPQANLFFGEPQWISVTETTNVKVAASGANRDPNVTIHQAFGDFKVAPNWRWILGRQVFSYGEEVLVGPSDWENPGTSFDGLRSRFEWQKSFLDIFTTKLWDSNIHSNHLGDRDFHGMYFLWAPPDQGYSFEPYVFWLEDRRSNPVQVLSSGIFMKIQLNELELKSEVTGQWGDRTGQQGWLSLVAPPLFNRTIRIGVDGFWSTAQFHPLFPSNHKWLGWSDVLGRRNLSGLGWEGKYQVQSQIEMMARGLYFLRTDNERPAYQWDGLTPVNLPASSNPHLGFEADFGLKVGIFEGTHAVVSGALFFPSASFKTQIDRDWIGRFEAAVESRF